MPTTQHHLSHGTLEDHNQPKLRSSLRWARTRKKHGNQELQWHQIADLVFVLGARVTRGHYRTPTRTKHFYKGISSNLPYMCIVWSLQNRNLMFFFVSGYLFSTRDFRGAMAAMVKSRETQLRRAEDPPIQKDPVAGEERSKPLGVQL